jgi:hypothetical protein
MGNDWNEIEVDGLDALADLFGPGDVIVVCTRAEAIKDGALIDVTETAREAGFKVPVALTAGAWERCVKMTPAAEEACNDVDGRLWDVLWMAYVAACSAPEAREVVYPVLVVTDSVIPEKVRLKLACGPGDEGEPVMTIMLPEED